MRCCKDDSWKASAVSRVPSLRPCFSSTPQFLAGRSFLKGHDEGVRCPGEFPNQNQIFLAEFLPVLLGDIQPSSGRKSPCCGRNRKGLCREGLCLLCCSKLEGPKGSSAEPLPL